MNAMTIADLPQPQELDREALAAISGSGRLAEQCVRGSHFKSAELAVQSSSMDYMINAFNNALKSIGEGIAQSARRG